MGEPTEPDLSGHNPDAETRRRIGVRVLLVMGVVLALLMVVFGKTTADSYAKFEAYRATSLEDPQNPPRWQLAARLGYRVSERDIAVDELLAWIEACPGVSSWCESSLPSLTVECLESQDRSAYCESVGDTIKSTRFGYDECSARYDQIDGRFARRYAKKHCSLIYRAIAGHCGR